MIVELLRVQCGCGNTLTGLFDNHHAAIVAGERAGWLMQSESIGGDLCPRCLGCEYNAVDDWKAYDESVAEQWHAYIELKRERDEARAEAIDAIRAKCIAEAQTGIQQGMREKAERERDEALSELRSLRIARAAWSPPMLPASARNISQREAARRALPLTGLEAQALEGALAMAERQRDEARAEVERLKAGREMDLGARDNALEALDRLAEHIAQHDPDRAHYIRTRALTDDDETWMSVPLSPSYKTLCAIAAGTWDTNDNGAIDDADELAAYAEASDLRALAERESVTEGGGDGL